MPMSARHLILLLFFIGPSVLGWGQYEEKVILMPEKRNSLGLNFTPAAVVFMNGDPIVSRFSLIYKRQTQVNFRWRVTLNYEILENEYDLFGDARVVNFNDSLITYRLNDIFHQAWDLRAGMEWFKPDRTFTMIYGIDLFGGIQTENDSYDDLTWDRDSLGLVPSTVVAPVNYEQEVNYGYVGLDFSIGQQIHAKENLFFVIRWTPQIAVYFPVSESYSDLDLRSAPPSGSTTFRLRGLEVYANVRF